MQSFPKPNPSLARLRLLAARARENRSAPNFPEQLLGHALAGCKLGVYFHSQVVLARRYIVDLWLPPFVWSWKSTAAAMSSGAALTSAGMRSFGGSGITCSGRRPG
jgi:hypothetical protein